MGRKESVWGCVGRGMAWGAGMFLVAFLLAWGLALTIQAGGWRVKTVAEAEGAAAVVRPVIRVAGGVALLLAAYCAVCNWVLVVGNWKRKTRASMVMAGVLPGAFAWWVAPAGSVWRGVALAVVLLDPGTWMLAWAMPKLLVAMFFGWGRGKRETIAMDGEDGTAADQQTGNGEGEEE